MYNLRQYQAFDLCQLLIKMKSNEIMSGLILSEQRTGKTRIAISAAIELLQDKNGNCLVICPKSSIAGWVKELEDMMSFTGINYNINIIKSAKAVSDIVDSGHFGFNIITYDLLKRLSINQKKLILGIPKHKHVMLIGDECHRLRNFKTLQSDAVFALKTMCVRAKINVSVLGITGTPAVKDSYDIFGSLGFINFSKISLNPTTKDFNEFKEYFYNCEDTSYGKVCRSLKRKAELNYIIQSCSVQTKQKNLILFKDYKKEYQKVVLKMDAEQSYIYNEVKETMEFDKDIDCKNALAKLTRLRQIGNDPSILVPSYRNIAPKLKYVIKFAKANDLQFIVFSKMTSVLNNLANLFDKYCIKYTKITGSSSLKSRLDSVKDFKEGNVQVILMQQDACRESLTLPEAKATIFLDRDFAQGYNDQAEARMTPVDGSKCTKYVIDLVMDNDVEEEIYNALVVKKESIDDVNVIYRKLKKKEVK